MALVLNSLHFKHKWRAFVTTDSPAPVLWVCRKPVMKVDAMYDPSRLWKGKRGIEGKTRVSNQA